MQRIVYTPAQPVSRPPEALLDSDKAYPALPAAAEAHAEMPGRAPEQAPQAHKNQTDILDQLMLDGAVQEPQLDTANGLLATNWAGEAHSDWIPLFRPVCQSVQHAVQVSCCCIGMLAALPMAVIYYHLGCMQAFH